MVDEFAALLRAYQERHHLSSNRLAVEIGVDPSYVIRIARAERPPPHRHLVLAMARGLHLSPFERNGFLLAAGHAPSSICQLGTWPPVLQAVCEVLISVELTVADQDAFSRIVCEIAERWLLAGRVDLRGRCGSIAERSSLPGATRSRP